VEIQTVYRQSHETYDVRQLQAELAAQRFIASRDRLAGLPQAEALIKRRQLKQECPR